MQGLNVMSMQHSIHTPVIPGTPKRFIDPVEHSIPETCGETTAENHPGGRGCRDGVNMFFFTCLGLPHCDHHSVFRNSNTKTPQDLHLYILLGIASLGIQYRAQIETTSCKFCIERYPPQIRILTCIHTGL